MIKKENSTIVFVKKKYNRKFAPILHTINAASCLTTRMAVISAGINPTNNSTNAYSDNVSAMFDMITSVGLCSSDENIIRQRADRSQPLLIIF